MMIFWFWSRREKRAFRVLYSKRLAASKFPSSRSPFHFRRSFIVLFVFVSFVRSIWLRLFHTRSEPTFVASLRSSVVVENFGSLERYPSRSICVALWMPGRDCRRSARSSFVRSPSCWYPPFWRFNFLIFSKTALL